MLFMKLKLVMAYKEKEIETICNSIYFEIEKGRPLRQVLKDKGMPSSQTFYKWLEDDEAKSKLYARACEIRADQIFDEMFDIADDGTNDYIEVDIGNDVKVSKLNQEHIQRSRLRIDTRKWALAKMNPKKYGDKIEVDQKQKQVIEFINVSKQFPDKE